ncbi:hypothetical protein AV530_006144 [Patagioenas fasciata monilis]|uniref:Uncharacterized protein n=1 Tax=Patagioenas fasciata monilis TaxID=372326 RepID=A0A1V4J8I0_PATFA|nr:hypothetical protein AV530_006144 [Patagioenas fasciata monilis]
MHLGYETFLFWKESETHQYVQDIYLKGGELAEELHLFEDTNLIILFLLHIWKVIKETSATLHQNAAESVTYCISAGPWDMFGFSSY